ARPGTRRFTEAAPPGGLRRSAAAGRTPAPLSHGCHTPFRPLTHPVAKLALEARRAADPAGSPAKEATMKSTPILATAALALAIAVPAAAQPAAVDSGIQPYAKTSGVSGNLSSIGSDTLNN